MQITSVVIQDWTTVRDRMPFRVIQSHEYKLYINYDKQILIVTLWSIPARGKSFH